MLDSLKLDITISITNNKNLDYAQYIDPSHLPTSQKLFTLSSSNFTSLFIVLILIFYTYPKLRCLCNFIHYIFIFYIYLILICLPISFCFSQFNQLLVQLC